MERETPGDPCYSAEDHNVMVSAAGTGNGPQKIPVTLKVSVDPSIVSRFASLAMAYQLKPKPTVSRAITLTSSTGVPPERYGIFGDVDVRQ